MAVSHWVKESEEVLFVNILLCVEWLGSKMELLQGENFNGMFFAIIPAVL